MLKKKEGKQDKLAIEKSRHKKRDYQNKI